MARLRPLLAILLIALAEPGHAQVARWRGHVEEASARFGVPVQWIERVMQAESGGRTHIGGRPIISRAGAMGLMQLMPGTWAELRSRYRLGDDPFDPRANILGGTAYLRMMHDQFGYPGLFAAYNAGPARYAAFLAGRTQLPRETVTYLASTAGVLDRPRGIARSVMAKADVSAVPPLNLQPSPARSPLFAIDRRPVQRD